jgi:hypothetical protein
MGGILQEFGVRARLDVEVTQGVDLHELETGRAKNVVSRNVCRDLVDDAGGARISVGSGKAEHFT